MKKTLVAVAAVVAATGAIAGNSVTLYGIADVYVGSLKAKGGAKTQTVLESGGLSSSRLGVKVKEELGGGLYGKVKFERGLSVDNGMNSGPRETWLGLGGNFGELRLGYNDGSVGDTVSDFVDVAQDDVFSAAGGEFGVWKKATSSRMKNSIRYVSPNFDGFYGSATLGLGEDKGVQSTPAGETGASNQFGAMVGYESGPFGIGFGFDKAQNKAYDHDNNDNTPKVKGQADPSSYHLGAYYDFGQFRLNGGLGQYNPDGGDKTKMVNLGASFNVDNIYVAASIARSKTGSAKSNAFGLEGRYNLSKRTTAYAGFTRGKDKGSKAGRLLAVGVRHKF